MLDSVRATCRSLSKSGKQNIPKDAQCSETYAEKNTIYLNFFVQKNFHFKFIRDFYELDSETLTSDTRYPVD